MNENISENIKSRLANVKRLYMIGMDHEKLGTEADKLTAILNYDASIEHLLNTILDFYEFQLEKERSEKFSTIWKNVNTVLERDNIEFGNKHSLPSAREICNFHKIRNSAQHYAIIPDYTSLRQFREITEIFLESVINKIFGINFSQLTLAILIKNIDVKKYVTDAEKYFLNDEFEQSANSSSIAFDIAKREEQQRIHGSGSLLMRLALAFGDDNSVLLLADSINPIDSDTEIDLLKIDRKTLAIHLIFEELEILKLGLDYKKYMHYKRISPRVRISSKFEEGKEECKYEIISNRKNYDFDSALFCLNFVTDTIIKWESFESESWLQNWLGI
jgi:hypothetical protein